MHRVRTLYKCLGYFLILEIVLQHVSPLIIQPPHNPKGEVEFINPKEIPDGSFSSEYVPSIEEIRVETNIRFRYAATKVISRIVNEDTKSHPVNFTLTIPSEAFITNLQMQVDGMYFNSNNVTSNEKAKEMYEYARREGRSVTAGILEQGKKANAFALNFIIGAKKTVRFRVTYEELLIRNDDKYEYTFNFKSTQVYISVVNYRIKATIDESQPIKVHVPDMHKEFSSGVMERQPKIRTISPTKSVVNWNWNNSYNDLSVIEKPFEDIFILQYTLENETASGEILIRNGHFVHFFAPVGMVPLTKHVVFVLDISDSMLGEKRRQLESAMLEILDVLDKNDFFNIITFSSDTQLWSYFHGIRSMKLYPFPAIEEYKQSAEYFIKKKLQPHGSTNIFAALEKAIEVCHNVSSKRVSDSSYTRNSVYYNLRQEGKILNETLPDNVESIIVFLTDGEPTSGIVDQMQLLQTIKEININPFVPIYSLAFGEAADYEFLKELSAQNGGFSRKIFEGASADIQVANFYTEISMPVMSNVTFKYTSKNPKFYFHLNVSQENHLIFKGREVVYYGQLPGHGNSSWNNSNFNAIIEGKTASGHVSYSSNVNAICVPASGFGHCTSDEESNDDMFLQRLFVYLDIRKFVMKDMSVNTDSYGNLNMSYCKGILDNAESFEDSANNRKPCEYIRRKQKVIDAAVKFKFVTPFTSLSMRTKSIAEDENDNVGQSQNLEQNWEWFLGSEIPAHKSMKISAVDTDASQQEIIAIPKPLGLTSSKHFHQVPNSTITAPAATIPNIPNNETSKAASRNPDTSMTKILDPGKLQLVLSLANIHLLSSINNTNSPNNKTRNGNLTLADVKWLGISEFKNIPTVNEHNKSVPMYYRILRDSEFNATLESSFELCPKKSPGDLIVECRHLKDCILRKFIDDFELFKSSYICAKEVGDERFLGTCCPLITTG